MIPISENHFQFVEEWCKYAAEGNEHPHVIAFIKESGMISFHMNKVGYPTARNWHYCSVILEAANGDINKAFPIMEPAIGEETAKMFKDFIEKSL